MVESPAAKRDEAAVAVIEMEVSSEALWARFTVESGIPPPPLIVKNPTGIKISFPVFGWPSEELQKL